MSIVTFFKSMFVPESTKMNPSWSSLTTFQDLPKPLLTPKNYSSYSKEGYRNNESVYKCISYISRNGAAIPPKLYTNTLKQKEITSHPLLDKLNKPNTEQSGVAYREAVIGFKLLSGNAYQYALRAKNGPPDELWPMRSDYVAIVAARTRGIVGYQYKFADAMYLASDVGHTKYWHPDNDEGYGLSPLEVAAIMVDQQTAAKKWNLSLLQNNARPPGAWSTPALLAKNDRDKLESKLNEKFAGFKNAGKFPVLDGGLTWHSMGLPPAQMDYLDMLKFNAGAIANIYNIAPQLIGDTSASTYNNMDQAKEASYTEAIFPELDDLYALWNNWLIPMYPDLKAMGAYLYYDKESIEVIQKVIQAQKDAIVTRATKIYMSGGCDLAQYQDMCGIKPDKNAKGIYRVGQVLVPSDKLQEYAEQSLQKPAGPPMLVPEPNLNMPTPGQAPLQGDTQGQPPKKPAQGQDQQEPTKKPAKKPVAQDVEQDDTGKKPDKAPKKSLKQSSGYQPDDLYEQSDDTSSNESGPKVYQPDDLDEQLSQLQDQDTQYVMWQSGGGSSCAFCAQNDGEVRQVGEEFPSGHILPPAHPNCDCSVVPVDGQKAVRRDESHILVATSTKADEYVRRLSRAPNIQKKTVPQGNDGVSVKPRVRSSRDEYRAFMERCKL